MPDDGSDFMNRWIRRARSPRIRLLDDGKSVEIVDDPLAEGPPREQPAPPTRPTGDIDQGARGSSLPVERSMSDRIRGALRAVRTPIYDDDRGDRRA
jgi:hypothetical protein